MKLNICLFTFAFCDNFEDDVCYRGGQEVPCDANPNSRTGNRLAPGSDDDPVVKRYNDLKGMATKLFKKKGNGEKFDERKYWAYGCHCFMLGDRPMSSDQPMPFGTPRDALDAKCRDYKHCQRCVRMKHGETCIGEFNKYTWRWTGRLDTLTSQNPEESCERDLFECDKQFVYNILEEKDVFDIQYHAFWGSGPNGEQGFVPSATTCPNPPGTVRPDWQCCGGKSNPFELYNAQNKICCNDQVTVVRVGETCPY